MDCQREYKTNQTKELEAEELLYIGEEDCNKYKAPKEYVFHSLVLQFASFDCD